MTCRHVTRHEPRVIIGRHQDDCADAHDTDPHGCGGCLPCPDPHCRVCGRTHANGTCAECAATTRDHLRSIATRCDALPVEVTHRGINSEAAMLWGPTADPEARGHVEASYVAGRLPEGWLEAAHGRHCPLLVNDACTGCAGPDLHPFYVLGKWDATWRDALNHDEPKTPDGKPKRLTLPEAVDYLDRQLTYMADYPHVPFEDFANDLAACHTHLEAVLHDQAHGDRANIGCFDCGGDLERKLTTRDGFEDWWTCSRCHRRYTQAEYNIALRAKLETSLQETA